MRFGQQGILFYLVFCSLVIGAVYFSYTSTLFSSVMECRATKSSYREEKSAVNVDLIVPAGMTNMEVPFEPDNGTKYQQPSLSCSRPDVATTSRWLAPIIWENTFDLTVIDAIYKPQNITVATTIFAVGKYVRFLKDLLESAEQHFLMGYQVHYYLFTDLPDLVPVVKLGKGRKLTVIKTKSSNRWQEISIRRMERIEKLIEEELLHKADYMFSLDVDSKFYGHWGAESLGDLIAVVHAWFFGLPREKFTYERRPESQAFIPYDEGDYYYGGAVFGGRPDKVLKLVKTCHMNLDVDQGNQIEAIWQEESHLNKYFLYNKPTKLLSPEYLWDDSKQKPSFIKVVRFTQVVKNYTDIRPNP